ncbi:hypothetical protein NDI56_21450 [Haloarcula sp. S1CR25-12]|uniref:ATP-binding protein n=1 Tax=Haloarcula saliterrae TaxID=2950534 RepID=A0ABU2FIA8_9EURY|nr:hypothetical protein [Haloarcula sp. S1CR25-12]MDS0261977.1 hypothetical protein [Haloarcula sp. S1CR25-12]
MTPSPDDNESAGGDPNSGYNGIFSGKGIDVRRAKKLDSHVSDGPDRSAADSESPRRFTNAQRSEERNLPAPADEEDGDDSVDLSDEQRENEEKIEPYDPATDDIGPGKALGDPIEARPYIHISPAREQVTPGNVVSGLFGLYRAGVTNTSRFNLLSTFGLKNYDKTFEFIIHKPRATKRFDFYLSATPYDATSFKNLAANVRAIYPESFEFEIVPFNQVAAFASNDGNAQVGGQRIAALDDIEDLERLDGFADPSVFEHHEIGGGNEPTPDEAEQSLHLDGVPLRPREVPPEKRPAIVQWEGVPRKGLDWMTLIQPFSDIDMDVNDQYRSPLSVLLEQAVHTDDPFVFQAVFSPRKDWTDEAEEHKRDLKMGNYGALSAATNEMSRQLFGSSDQERQNLHRGEIPEQVGGTLNDGDSKKTTGSRMAQIDHKQPTTTFDLTLRAASDPDTVQSISNAFTSLSGPYYGIEGKILDQSDKPFSQLCHARQNRESALSGLLSNRSPIIVVSPDELANFVVAPSTDALPRASRGSSGGSPDARAPLTATDEDMLSKYDTGMHIGSAETAVENRPDIPIRLSAEQLTHHILRAATTGGGKTTAMINDALSAYEAFDGPTFIFDKKGGSMSEEYKRAHFHKFGSLDNVIHLPVPGPEEEVLAFPYFDIRPQLAAGVSRTVAVQEKIDRYNELLVYVLGSELTQQAFVAQEILNNLIKALFDPEHGRDAWPIEDLLKAAFEMQEGEIPEVSDDTLRLTLSRHLHADEQRFQTSIDAVMNRITKLAERSFIWRILNFVPEWDDEAGAYADQSPMFDIQDLLDSRSVVLIDTGDLRPASSNLFTFMLLDYIWSGARLRHRIGETPSVRDDYVINLIIDEAAPLLQSELVRDDMIPDGREFGLAMEVIVHFAEQVKADALDVASYKEILRNINTKLIGKLAVDDELVMTLFHEGIESEELVDRITSLPRGEWVAQLPDTGFMTDIPELVTLLPVDIPAGHTASGDPVTTETVSPYGILYSDAADEMSRRTRDDYCLLPGSNTKPSAQQVSNAKAEPSGPSVTPDGLPQSPATSGSSGDSGATNNLGTSLGGGRSPTAKRNEKGSASKPREDGDEDDGGTHPRPVPTDDLVDDLDATKSSTTRATRPPADSAGTKPDSEPVPNQQKADSGGKGESPDGGPNADSEIDTTLSVDERRFLTEVVTTVNGRHPTFDILDSMAAIKNQFSDIDLEKLEDLGYLEVHEDLSRIYYTVTGDGQMACGASVATGENQGDVNEKTVHKVLVEALARSLANDRTNQYFISKYSLIDDGAAKPDLAAYDGERLALIGEAISNSPPYLIVKHFDDYNAVAAERKVWIVPNISVAWEIVRALSNAGRIGELPAKREGLTYEDLNAEIWGENSDWEFAGGRELIRELE